MFLWAQYYYEHSCLQLNHCSRFILTLCEHCLQILWLCSLPGSHLDYQWYHWKAVAFSVLSSFLLKGICNYLLKAIMNLVFHILSLGTDMWHFSSWRMREGMYNWTSEPASQVTGFWDKEMHPCLKMGRKFLCTSMLDRGGRAWGTESDTRDVVLPFTSVLSSTAFCSTNT